MIIKLLSIITSIMVFALAAVHLCADPNTISWHDAKTLTIEGRAWNDVAGFYDRLPARAQAQIPQMAWDYSRNSAGMVVRFVTNAPEISVRWKLTSDTLSYHHMTAIGVSGVDLYVRHKEGWHWLAVGVPTGKDNESKLIWDMPRIKREFALYLPLYNGVSSVEIGLPEGVGIEAAPARSRNIKPVVFYGSSITQGGCASRPGMVYTSIIGRKLDIPIVNLGLSGSGKCEHEIADLLVELNPEVYVIDCIPNMEESYVDERIRYLFKRLKEKRSNTPVILVEEAAFQSNYIRSSDGCDPINPKNVILEKIYRDFKKDWHGHLYYVKGNTLIGTDGEATVDGCHRTDLGFERMANVLTPVLEKALAR